MRAKEYLYHYSVYVGGKEIRGLIKVTEKAPSHAARKITEHYGIKSSIAFLERVYKNDALICELFDGVFEEVSKKKKKDQWGRW